jgi:hypothetical protein
LNKEGRKYTKKSLDARSSGGMAMMMMVECGGVFGSISSHDKLDLY